MGEIADEHESWIADDLERLGNDPDYFNAYDQYSSRPRAYAAQRPAPRAAVDVLADFDDLTEELDPPVAP